MINEVHADEARRNLGYPPDKAGSRTKECFLPPWRATSTHSSGASVLALISWVRSGNKAVVVNLVNGPHIFDGKSEVQAFDENVSELLW
jgi:hypothetical protein